MSVQLTTVEGKQRKKFTARQRLEILREWDSTGNGVLLDFRLLEFVESSPIALADS